MTVVGEHKRTIICFSKTFVILDKVDFKLKQRRYVIATGESSVFFKQRALVYSAVELLMLATLNSAVTFRSVGF